MCKQKGRDTDKCLILYFPSNSSVYYMNKIAKLIFERIAEDIPGSVESGSKWGHTTLVAG